jgi:hypothetical protein
MRWLALVCAVGCGGSHATPDGAGSGDGQGLGSDARGGADRPWSCPVGQWCQETAPSGTTRLAAVWETGVGDVFAVGDAGTILFRHADAWAQQTSNTTLNLRGVWAASASDAWAVGDTGTILHYDGTSWNPISSVTTVDLAAVWGANSSDVWVVGPNAAWHWTGSSFASSSLAGVLLAVTGTGPSDVWTCGETANVRHYTGSWSSAIVPVAGNTTYYAIAADASEVWVSSAASSAETARFDGSSWTPYGTSGAILQSLYAASPGDIWGAAGNKIGHWTGSAWSFEQPTGVTGTLWSVAGAGPDVFIVGDGGVILHRD